MTDMVRIIAASSSMLVRLHLEPRLLPLAAGLELRNPHCLLDGLRCRCAGGASSISCCPVCCYAILREHCQLLVVLLHVGDNHMVDHTSHDGGIMAGTSESQNDIVPLVLSAWRMSRAAAAAAGLLHDLQLHPQQHSGPHQPQPPCDHAQLYFHASEPAVHMALWGSRTCHVQPAMTTDCFCTLQHTGPYLMLLCSCGSSFLGMLEVRAHAICFISCLLPLLHQLCNGCFCCCQIVCGGLLTLLPRSCRFISALCKLHVCLGFRSGRVCFRLHRHTLGGERPTISAP